MPALTFQQAVEATADIATGYQKGLTALGAYHNKVEATNNHLLQGSVDIDTCTTAKYPQENRWDFAVAYNGEVFFIEVHSANTSEVRTVIKKLNWLKDWLHHKAPEINKLKAKTKYPFYWVQSKNFQIPRNSPQYIAAVNAGLKPIPKLIL